LFLYNNNNNFIIITAIFLRRRLRVTVTLRRRCSWKRCDRKVTKWTFLITEWTWTSYRPGWTFRVTLLRREDKLNSMDGQKYFYYVHIYIRLLSICIRFSMFYVNIVVEKIKYALNSLKFTIKLTYYVV